jgi:RimJ/RimL family protein N-acetyltransferase
MDTRRSTRIKGYAKEALKSIYDWAVLNFEADYFVYPVAEQNYASRKLAKVLGEASAISNNNPNIFRSLMTFLQN